MDLKHVGSYSNMPNIRENLSKFVERGLGTMVNELGAVWNGILILLGDQFGLYKAIANSGGLTVAELARRTETGERYVREWASAQAASGFVNYHPETQTFSMTPEQIAVFADPNSPR